MNNEKTKKLAFAVGIVVIVLSSILFLWTTYQAIGYGYSLHELLYEQVNDGSLYFYISTYKAWFAVRIVFSILSLLLLCGVVFLFIYLNRKAKNKEEINN